MGRLAERVEQLRLRRLALDEEGVVDPPRDALGHRVHVRVGGEEDEGPPARQLEQAHDLFGRAKDELGRLGLGHPLGHVEHRLLLVAERRGQEQLAGRLEAQAVLHVREAAVDGEGGRGQDRRPHLPEQQLLQAPRHVDRHRAQEDAPAAGLHEVDVVVGLGPHQEGELARELERAAGEAREGLGPVGHGEQSRAQALEPLQQAERLLGHPGAHPARPQPARAAAREQAEEAVAAQAHALDLGPHVARVEGGRLQLPLDVAGEVLHPVRRDVDAEVLRRDVLDEVRLVEDDRVVGGHHLAVAAVLHREVRAEQVVVHDHEVGLERALAHPRHEARVEQRARLADAVLARRRDLAPELDAVRHVLDLGAVPGLREGGPRLHRAEDRDLLEAAEGTRLAEGGEAQQAEVVRPALHDRDAQLAAEGAGEDRDVLLDELLLEVLGAGGDDHAAAELDRGEEIRESLAGAGAGLGEKQPARVEHLGHRLRELALGLALLVAGEDPCQGAVAVEEARGGDHALTSARRPG